MYLAGKNIGENLAVSKEVAILAVPRRRRFFESKTNIRFTADKAGFFFGRFLFGEVDVLADFQKSLASFVIYIQQIFVSIMPRRDKNLTADARTASASTPTARKYLLPPALRRRNLSKLSQPVTSTRHSLTTSFIVAPLRRFLAGVSVSKKATSPLRRRTASRARSTPFVVSIETDSLWPSL